MKKLGKVQKLVLKEFAKLEKRIEKIFEKAEREGLEKLKANGIVVKPSKRIEKPIKIAKNLKNAKVGDYVTLNTKIQEEQPKRVSRGGVKPVCQVCHCIVENVDEYGICRACSSTMDAKNLREKLDHEFTKMGGFALFELEEGRY